MDVLIARLSSPGLQRELKEDNYLIMEQQNFAALFDGMTLVSKIFLKKIINCNLIGSHLSRK